MNYTKLRQALISVLFLIPLIGLIVSSSLFFPYITGKNIAFRILIEVAAVLYVCLALRMPEYRPKVTSMLLAFLAFLGVLFVADLNAEYPFKAFFSNFERMEGFVTLAHLFAYFVILGSVFNSDKLWRRFFQVSLGVSVIMGFIGLGQLGRGVGRIDAQLGNPTYFGAYMLFHIFLGTYLLVRHLQRSPQAGKWIVAAIYGAVIAFDLVIFYYTGTRGALLGLVAGLLFMSAAFAIFEKNKALKYGGIGVLVVILLTISLLAGFKESSFVKSNNLLSRFAALATFDKAGLEEFVTTQGKSRFAIWGIALKGFQERPILGWGQDNFNYVFNKYYDAKIYDQEAWFDRAHNVFFDWLIAGGILGLLSYLALFIFGIVSVWRSKLDSDDVHFYFSDKVILTALLIAYFIHNLFVFDNLTSYILFFGVLAYIHTHEKRVVSLPLLAKPIAKESYVMAGSIIAIIAGGAVFYYAAFIPYVSAKSLIVTLTYQNYGLANSHEVALKETLDQYQKTIKYGGPGTAEAREQLVQGATSVVFGSKVPNQSKMGFINAVKIEMGNQIKETPNDARYQLFFGSFLSRLYGVDTSVTVDQPLALLTKAHELSPNKQAMLFEIGALHIRTSKYAEAVETLKKAYELEPENAQARIMYAVALIYSRNDKLADEIMLPLKGTEYATDNNLIRAYYDTKQNAKISAILDLKITLAKQHAAEGRVEQAIREVNEVISINPAFKAQGEALIKQFSSSTPQLKITS